MVQILAFAQKPQRVARADPVCTVVFGVAVACDDPVAVRKRLVHAGDIIGGQDIVRVEDEKAVEGVGAEVAADVPQKKVHRIPLADQRFVLPFIDGRAAFACDAGGRIGAVVGGDENAHKLGRIILRLNASNQVGDDRFFVARADQNGKTMQFGGCVGAVAFHVHERDIQKLVAVTDKKDDPDDKVDGFDDVEKFHACSGLLLTCLLLCLFRRAEPVSV